MRAELRGIEASDIPTWPEWTSPDPAEELQWFTLTIGPPGDPGSNYFQVAVATPAGIKKRRDKKRPFVGLVVDRFDPPAVEQTIRDFVASAEGLTWDAIVKHLRRKLLWEYEGYS